MNTTCKRSAQHNKMFLSGENRQDLIKSWIWQ